MISITGYGSSVRVRAPGQPDITVPNVTTISSEQLDIFEPPSASLSNQFRKLYTVYYTNTRAHMFQDKRPSDLKRSISI